MPTPRPASESERLVAAHIAAGLGGPRPPDALGAACRDALARIEARIEAGETRLEARSESRKRARGARRPLRLILLEEPRPVGLVTPGHILISRGLFSVLARRSLAVDRAPFDRGRVALTLLVWLRAHHEIVAPELRRRLELDAATLEGLRRGRLPGSTAGRLRRRLRSVETARWSDAILRRTRDRAVAILARLGLPASDLLAARDALLPPEPRTETRGLTFASRFRLDGPVPAELEQQLAARGPVPLAPAAARRGRELARLARREVSPRADAARLRAEARVRRGAFAAALDDAREAAGRRPADAAALALLGEITLALGQTVDAASALRRALLLQPDHARARLTRARMDLRDGRLAAARRQAEDLLRDHPLMAEVHALLAAIAAAEGRDAEPRRRLAAALGAALGAPR